MVAKCFRVFFKVLTYVAAFLYFVATAITVANVIGRYVFGHSIFGSEELASYAVLIMSFLMFTIIEAKTEHLSIDILVNKLKNEKLKTIQKIIVGVVDSCVFGCLAYYGLKVTKTAVMYSSVSPTLHIPKGIVFGITTAAFIIAILGWVGIIFFNKRRPL